MKKVITILMACVLLSALFVTAAVPASAKKSKSFSYISMTLAADLKGQDQYIRWIIPWDDIFEDGKMYTLYATAMFENVEPNGGCAFVNMYSYDDLDAAVGGDWSHLVQFKDYAKYPADDGSVKLGEWVDFEYTGDFSEALYGGFTGPKTGNKANLEAVWITIGFYLATGTINVRELGVKDDSGKVIYSQSFEDGLDFDEPYFQHSNDISPETEGETWKILTTEKKEESSEEPEPVVESSDEPEPVVESSDEPEPVVESSDEPEPVESSDEPAPVESSEEPEPIAEPSENPEDKSEPESQAQEPATSEENPPAASSAGFPWWGWLLIGLGCVAIVCVVLAIVLKKKKA